MNTSGLAPSILTYEFKRDLNAYLGRTPGLAPMDSPADIIRPPRSARDCGARDIGYGTG